MLGIAVGGKTMKMHQGHHGANHPVKDLTTGKVEITSMNHGFAVDKDSAAEERRADACLAVRRLQLRHRAQGQAGVLGAVPPGSLARPARQPLSVHALRRHDAAGQRRKSQAQDRVSDVRLDQLLRFQAFGDLRECASSRRALPHHRRGHPRAMCPRPTRACSTMAAARRPRPICVAAACGHLTHGGGRAQCARRAQRALCRQSEDFRARRPTRRRRCRPARSI